MKTQEKSVAFKSPHNHNHTKHCAIQIPLPTFPYKTQNYKQRRRLRQCHTCVTNGHGHHVLYLRINYAVVKVHKLKQLVWKRHWSLQQFNTYAICAQYSRITSKESQRDSCVGRAAVQQFSLMLQQTVPAAVMAVRILHCRGSSGGMRSYLEHWNMSISLLKLFEVYYNGNNTYTNTLLRYSHLNTASPVASNSNWRLNIVTCLKTSNSASEQSK